jgi:hypothetical protein
MHQVTVTIADIERATRNSGNHKYQRTLSLAFRSQDGARHWWEVPGWPEVSSGMTVTALLRRPYRPKTSNTVLGWRRHDTEEIVVGLHPVRFAVGAAIFASVGALTLHLYSLYPDRSSLSTPIPGVAFFVISALLLTELVKSIAVRVRLGALRNSSGVSS